MTETKKTINSLLIAAIGIAAYVVCDAFIVKIGFYFCGPDIGKGIFTFININFVELVIILGVVMILSLLKKSTKTIRCVAIGMEVLPIIANFLFAFPIGRVLNLPETYFIHATDAMRFSVIYMFIGSAVAIAVRKMMTSKGLLVQLMVLASVFAITILTSYILMYIMKLGAPGNAIGFLQAFCIFQFVTALSNAPIKFTSSKSSTFSYLEQYKQKMQNGGK